MLRDMVRKVAAHGPDGECHPFRIDPGRREALLEGWDAIAVTERESAAIAAFQARQLGAMPWLGAGAAS